MANNYFNFKQFSISQDKSAFKVGTDGVLLGASADIDGVTTILDVGTGTGLIAIMLAQRCNAIITAIEPDDDSFIQSSENVDICKWHDRIKVEHTRLQDFNPVSGDFDLIVINPPYFSNSVKNPDPLKSAARHNDNLNSDDILSSTSRLLKEGGRLQVIMPFVEGSIFIAEANKFGFYCNRIIKIKPTPSSEIRRLILTFNRFQGKTTESFLTIEHGKRHEFTEEYINLTKDFYLKF
jgi:tRNA1Val (adenine37-N6)-methyltransferase